MVADLAACLFHMAKRIDVVLGVQTDYEECSSLIGLLEDVYDLIGPGSGAVVECQCDHGPVGIDHSSEVVRFAYCPELIRIDESVEYRCS